MPQETLQQKEETRHRTLPSYSHSTTMQSRCQTLFITLYTHPRKFLAVFPAPLYFVFIVWFWEFGQIWEMVYLPQPTSSLYTPVRPYFNGVIWPLTALIILLKYFIGLKLFDRFRLCTGLWTLKGAIKRLYYNTIVNNKKILFCFGIA